MKGFVVIICLLAGLYVAEAHNKTIVIFPSRTYTDYMILKTRERPLRQITVCLRSFSELTREHSLFSLAMHGKDNAFLIFPYPPNQISISVNNEDLYFLVDPQVLKWRHTCVTWDSYTGLLQLWINGKRYPRRVTKTRSPIGPQISVILGQEQDKFGGGFHAKQSFVGEISDVNMWDYVLKPSRIEAYFGDYYSLRGNVYNWVRGRYEVKGSTFVLKNQCIPNGNEIEEM